MLLLKLCGSWKNTIMPYFSEDAEGRGAGDVDGGSGFSFFSYKRD